MTNAALCRVCLASDTKMHHIANTRLQEIFEKLSTKLSTADRRPETVCYICFSHLQRCRQIVDMSRRAEGILTQFLLNGNQVTGEDVTELNLSLKQHLSVVPVSCLSIVDVHDSSNVTVKQEVTDDESAEKEFSVETTYNCNSLHVAAYVESIKEEGKGEAPLVETETQNLFSPEKCNIAKECLKFEEDSEHEDYNKLPSTINVEQPKNTYYTCDICDKRFTGKRGIALHMGIHTGKRPYACDTCDRKYRYKSSLSRHTCAKPYYDCDICYKKFTEKASLALHKRIHTGEKPHACDVCDKKFTQQSTLMYHKKVHTGEKAYACAVCNKKMRRQSYLKRHMRIHTGEKPYACDVCDKRFCEKSTLTQHKKVHSRQKPLPVIYKLMPKPTLC